jgi:hypothetical protein
MKRRHIAALAVIIPIAVVTLLKLYYPLSYKMLSGYMLAVALVFKTALFSFYSASKLKILAFIKGLTFLQGSYLLLKRWFLDTIFARWLQKNVTDHIKVGLKELGDYYKALNLRAKMRNFFIPLFLSLLSAWALYATGYLDNLLLFTEIKVIVIGISKTILMMGAKFFGFMINSWITPILEVFALSWLFGWLERVLGSQNPIVRSFNWVGAKLNTIFFFFADINKKHIDPLLNDRVSKQSRNLSSKISDYIKHKKIDYEYEQFEKFEQRILKGHIGAYHTFKGMEKVTDKKELYTLINKKTDDNLDIVAFVSRNSRGELLPELVEDSFYHDIFILEGIASSHKHGIKQEQETDPDHSDFWVLNTSAYPAVLRSHSGHVPPQEIEANILILVKTDYPHDYRCGDIYFEFRGRTETINPIAPHH